jgi:outer membrane autotransporter protein
MREGRDTAAGGNAGDPGARFWFQGYGRLSERDGAGSFTTFGQTRNVDLSHKQDFFGGQIGADFGGAVGDQGGFAFGVTGGYVDSQVNFQNAGDDLSMRAVNVGAYGRFSTGMFFVNALAKYDHVLDVQNRSIIGDFDVDLDGNLYGAKLEGGFRFGGSGFYLEPVASIAYVNSDLDGFVVRGTSVEFDNEHGLRGTAGARIGSQFGISNGAVANVYAGAHYVHEFGGSDEVLLASGATNVRLTALEDDDYVKALVGINVAGTGRVSGFIEGNSEFLNDRQGLGMRGGLRIRF